MSDLSLRTDPSAVRGSAPPWHRPERYWPSISGATADQDPPFAVGHLPALRHNLAELIRRAAGKPIRIASKSLRVRGLVEDCQRVPGVRGVLAYTLAEAIWLAGTVDDVVVGYPSVDRTAIAALIADAEICRRVTIMIDDPAQLDLIDAIAAPSRRPEIAVCLELDASLDLAGRHLGVYRSPLHTPEAVLALARQVLCRRGFRLVGLMAYEAQIAGLGNAVPGRPARSAVVRRMQQRSAGELAQRRGRAVRAIRELLAAAGRPDLEFVNGGGTGSIESTTADGSVTEIAAGSGIFGSHLFDGYRDFTPAPAVGFALSVVRRPRPGIATVQGGGWIASGPPGADRSPLPVWPTGLSLIGTEGAGEVQTPLRGPNADRLAIGDRVWFRHSKAGEISEHVDSLMIIDGSESGDWTIIDRLPTYRGEGRTFL
ncbi:amino acid deaminase/aldolase [Microlunatus soli]|uniref:D-serine deaminase, pyridoxal phosphate-dependent n=1 Tax=Microlunatus soli TaxID=630515 RepID=A0A1H1YFT2_9ACTN|nr:amino acid deaminase/aldolase [Microlunatus soli]SDT20231.1 D-serine deaminase, pyridoxal phosphate-dependent [Microlunatus soli]